MASSSSPWRRNRIALSLLLLLISTLLQCVTSNADTVSKFVDLDIDNFVHVVQQHEFTCVFLYDPWDDRGVYEYTMILEGIHDKFASRSVDVGFARLNGRQHVMLRDEYTATRVIDDDDDDTPADNPFAKDYYDQVVDNPTSLLTMTNETLLDVSLGTVYWPASLLVLARNYNLYGQVDLSVILGALPLRIHILDRWLVQATELSAETMEPLVTTRANLEHDLLKWRHRNDNSFNFYTYQMKRDKEELRAEQQQDDTPPTHKRLLLETDSKDDGKSYNDGFFTYKRAKIKKLKEAHTYLNTLGIVIEEYLAWAEGYEVSWSEDRKRVEDEETNFGYYLNEMNDKVQALLDELLDTEAVRDKKLLTKMRIQPDYGKQMTIPPLKAYFEEMIFGVGRNSHRMRHALEEMKSDLGSTPHERRQNRYDFNATQYPFVQRLREYLQVHCDVDDELLYAGILADLLKEWYNILREFHRNLNQHYVDYLEQHPRPHGNTFQFQTMDVLDMEDPNDFDVLGNYDYFHERYTRKGVPVILTNVEMAHDTVDLEYIVAQCAMSDVTSSVHISRKVGERQAGSGWGGLEEYVLEEELMTHHRRLEEPTAKKKDGKKKNGFDDFEEDDGNEDDDDEDEWDRTITMEQFAILSRRLDHLYLHDYALPDKCETILYDDTPYNPRQKFQLPSVIASYDLFQRLPQSKYADSWPSLFVGRKGSNSKLHIDSGATGFFMYLVEGRKRWIVYNRDERVHLYEKISDYATYPDVLGMGKDDASDDFLSERFPLLHRAAAHGGAYEIIQDPGQLVYIPPSCPHAVENLEDIIGFAMNVVPRDGIVNHLHEQTHSSAELGMLDMVMNYWLFEDNADKPTPTKDPLYTTYAEYKSQY